MGYIRQVKDTANQKFDLRDKRVDSGKINVLKDWLVNDPESFKYIKNRTHYDSNRFELIHPSWDGAFGTEELPFEYQPDTISVGTQTEVLYKVSNIQFTSTSVQDFEEELATLIVRYQEDAYDYGIGNFGELFEEQALTCTLTWIDQDTEKVRKIEYGTAQNKVILYNVSADKKVQINGVTVKLTEGIYAFSIPGVGNTNTDIRAIKYPDQPIELDQKYIPEAVWDAISDAASGASQALTNYYTKTQVEELISTSATTVTTTINNRTDGLLANKMDKTNPIGSGNFYLLEDQYGNKDVNIAGDVYTNYTISNYYVLDNGSLITKTEQQVEELGWPIEEVTTLPAVAQAEANKVYKLITKKILSTKDYVDTGLASKMNANKYQFTQLQVYRNGSYRDVLTQADLPAQVTPTTFRGFITDEANYTPSGSTGDYYYKWAAYTINGSASAQKFVYNGVSWQADPTGNLNYTFSDQQWKNINTDIDTVLAPYITRIIDLEGRVADLKDRFDTMFEFAEGQQF